MKLKIIAAFAILNIVIFFAVGMLWAFPIVGSLRDGRAELQMLERRYSSERGFLRDYENNLRELEEIRATTAVFSGDEKIPALAEFSRMSAEHGLENSEFAATAISVSGSERLSETRVSAEFSGAFSDMISFLHELTDSGGKVRSLYVSENSRLRLEFSIFGGEE